MATSCRYCGRPLEHELIDLGSQPLANNYLEASQAAIETEQRFPLRVMVCDGCFLVQVEEHIQPEDIFRHDYAYYSSYSSSWVEHARRYAQGMISQFRLGGHSTVIEIASNDGYLLQHFVASDVPSLGIEPAAKCADIARAKGIPTIVDFFNHDTARRLANDGVAADLMVANNVLAHVPAINDFIAGFTLLLKSEGVVTFEFPHLLRIIQDTQFDTIYHEHCYYLSLRFVEALLAEHGLRVFHVEALGTHGGSLRVFACHERASHSQRPSVAETREAERAAALGHLDGYSDFANQAVEMRDALCRFFDETRSSGMLLAAYGAAAKGNTFLNFCEADTDDVAFVVDRNPEKQGHLLPGSHIPIRDPSALSTERPDLVLILPWNLAREIRTEYSYIADWGGRFVIGAPRITIF